MNESNHPGDHGEPSSQADADRAQQPDEHEPDGSETDASDRGDAGTGTGATTELTEPPGDDTAQQALDRSGGNEAAASSSDADAAPGSGDAGRAQGADEPSEDEAVDPGQAVGAGAPGGDTGETAGDEDRASGPVPPPGDGGGRGRPPPKRRWTAGVIAVLVLALVGGLGAGAYRVVQRLERLESQLAAVPQERKKALERFARSDALAKSIESLEGKLDQRLGTLETRIKEVSSQRAQAAQKLRQRLNKLQEAVAAARELAGRDQLDWRLAEVHYLVSVAARRLAVAHDRRAAIAALKAADRSLAAVGDVRLIELRQRIIDRITTLEGIEPADVEGIALRIQSMLQRLPDLPPADEAPTPDGAQQVASSEADGWWQQVRERLSRYIIIRRQAGESGPARPRADKALPASEKLGFALSEARRAALRREPTPYRAALERARGILERRFAGGAPTVERFRETVAKLHERAVVTDYPDLTKTLDAVEKVSAELKAKRQRPDLVESKE